MEPTASTTSRLDLKIEHYQPSQALGILGTKLDQSGKEYSDLRHKLELQPGFLRISEEDLLRLGKLYDDVVNITGYSGQGVHPQQRELYDHAFSAIMEDMGWGKSHSLVISGGTALGMPHMAMESLSKRGYQAVAVMALPGVAYPMSPGYSFVCADDAWTNWGDETNAMAKVSTATILTGGGTQALNDALIAMKSKERVAVIANAFNGLARIPYEMNGAPGELILRADQQAAYSDSMFNLKEFNAKVAAELKKGGASDDDLKTLRVTGLPVSGLVTESKKGERRACAQDLLYYAITGNQELLPTQFRSAELEEQKAFQAQVLKEMNLYYLFDNPSEGVVSSAVLKLGTVLDTGNVELFGRIIDHAVMHDVYSSKSNHFGPVCLDAHTPHELARTLKQALLVHMSAAMTKAPS